MSAEKKVKTRLKKVNEPTKIEGQSIDKAAESSYFSVYDLQFSEPTAAEIEAAAKKAAKDKETAKDNLDKLTLTISGNEFAIALQASLLDAVRDLFRYELEKLKLGSGDSREIIKRSGHPEVKLFFFQKRAEAEEGYAPLKGEISFDLMNFVDSSALVSKTNQLITEADVKNLSKKIREVFTAKFSWKRGNKILVYHDWARGYNFKIYCNTQAEGIRIVKQVLSIQGHEIRQEYLKLNQMVSPKPVAPKVRKEKVLGKELKHKRYRPEATVWYSYATLHLPSYGQKIALG